MFLIVLSPFSKIRFWGGWVGGAILVQDFCFNVVGSDVGEGFLVH